MSQGSNVCNDFKEFEYQGWQQSAEQYHTSFGKLTSQTIEPLLDSVEAKEGKKLLDIATGPGYVAAVAQSRQCRVTALDFSEAMLDKARQVHPQIEFVSGDAESLPFDDCQFDVAVMNFGILHLANPETAIAEAFRVLKPQGKFAFTSWGLPENSAAFEIMMDAIKTHGQTEVSIPEGPAFFHFSNPDTSIKTLQSVGFANPQVQTFSLKWELENPEELFTAFYQGTARTGGLLRSQTPQSLEAIRIAVNNATLAYKKNDQLILPMTAMVNSAQKREGVRE